MGASIHVLTVALDRDYDEEAAQRIANAIAMVRGVARVSAIEVASDDHLARLRVGLDIRRRLIDALDAEIRR